MRGFLELVNHQQLRGWVFWPEQPATYLTVHARCGLIDLGSATADLFRSDLKDSNIGNGDHAFVINLRTELTDKQLEDVQVTSPHPSDGNEFLLKRIDANNSSSKMLGKQVEPFGRSLDLTPHPVLVVGAARSGTSAIAQGLLATGKYEGQQEGHFIPVLRSLIQNIQTFYERNREETFESRDTLIRRVPEDVFIDCIKATFIEVCAAAYPSGHWLDKTPTAEMIYSVSTLCDIFPNTKVIFVHRRGVENIASRLRKFPTLSFAHHCHDWTTVMRAWLEVRQRLSERCIELRQLEISESPERCSDRLSGFLNLSVEQSRILKQALRHDQPEKTGSSTGATYNYDDLHWTEEQKSIFTEICGPMMQAYGYAV